MKTSEIIADEIRNAEIPMSDRLSRALERVESIEQQRDELQIEILAVKKEYLDINKRHAELLAAAKSTRRALAHASSDPLYQDAYDQLDKAITKAQGDKT
jgi:uncharacterized coiled-coil DUF342 family protein